MSKNMRQDSDKSPNTSKTSQHKPNGQSGLVSKKGSHSASGNGTIHPDRSPEMQTNGSASVPTKTQTASFFGHDRQEVARLIIQALNDLGYNDSANKLVQESGFDLESPSVAALRHAILDGDWAEAEALLFGVEQPEDGGGVSIGNGYSGRYEGLPIAEGVDKDELRFQLRRQKYLELLEERDHGSALMVLRQELTPLHQNVAQLHILSGFMVCPSVDDLKSQSNWDGAKGTSRNALLAELSRSISPSVMIPDHRLADLFDQVKQSQISKCVYHNPISKPSLFADHFCERNQFPLQTVLQLSHRDEVYYIAFSPNGKMLAACGKDKSVTIYNIKDFDVAQKLSSHTAAVGYVAWSPNSERLISCSQDCQAKLWDVQNGRLLNTIVNHSEPVTAAAWAPDGQSFVTGSLDLRQPLNMWAEDGSLLYKWAANYRVQDLAISPDGQRLIAISTEKEIFVYRLQSRVQEYSVEVKAKMTCVSVSADSTHILVNLVDSELQLIEIETTEVTQRYRGQKQGEFMIRSAFAGNDDNLIITGSEDGKIYIFHKERGTLIECLDGHIDGCANAIAWNPTDNCMFASCGDDHKIRIWSKSQSPTPIARSRQNGTGAFQHDSVPLL